MKKIWMAALLSCLLTPAYADNRNQQNFDRDELSQQLEIVNDYAEEKMAEIARRKWDTLSPEQKRRLMADEVDERAENEVKRSIRRQFIQSWAGHMNQCYASNTAARLCAYQDMFFHQLIGLREIKQLGHQPPPLHARTRAWMRQNPRLSNQASAEIAAIIHEAGL